VQPNGRLLALPSCSPKSGSHSNAIVGTMILGVAAGARCRSIPQADRRGCRGSPAAANHSVLERPSGLAEQPNPSVPRRRPPCASPDRGTALPRLHSACRQPPNTTAAVTNPTRGASVLAGACLPPTSRPTCGHAARRPIRGRRAIRHRSDHKNRGTEHQTAVEIEPQRLAFRFTSGPAIAALSDVSIVLNLNQNPGHRTLKMQRSSGECGLIPRSPRCFR